MITQIQLASVEFIEQPFLKPLQISSGLITQATEARVTVTVRVGGVEGTGRGSIYLSDLWAWPSVAPDRIAKDQSMRGLCREIASSLNLLCSSEAAHPLELGLRLHHAVSALPLTPDMPLLARAVCASPFDAAIHDAAGQALGLSAFRFYETDTPIPSANRWFPKGGAVRGIRRALRPPVHSLNAWWVVGAKDDLETGVRPAVRINGISRFKIKVLARDSADDAARTVEIYRAARGWGLTPTLSVDSNEGNPDAANVLDYLERMEALDREAYAALAYLEQPTARDIAVHPQDWRAVARRKPVLLDEGLTSFDLLPIAREQHWSGLALKTCKGHSFSLVAACCLCAVVPGVMRFTEQGNVLGLVAPRTLDAIEAIEASRGPLPAEVAVIGRGPSGVVALCAAALDPRITRVVTMDSLASYVTDVPYVGQQIGIMAPGILRDVGDIPQIAALIAPRPLIVAGGVSADGRALELSALKRNYEFTRGVFASDNAQNNFVYLAPASETEVVASLSGTGMKKEMLSA